MRRCEAECHLFFHSLFRKWLRHDTRWCRVDKVGVSLVAAALIVVVRQILISCVALSLQPSFSVHKLLSLRSSIPTSLQFQKREDLQSCLSVINSVEFSLPCFHNSYLKSRQFSKSIDLNYFYPSISSPTHSHIHLPTWQSTTETSSSSITIPPRSQLSSSSPSSPSRPLATPFSCFENAPGISYRS